MQRQNTNAKGFTIIEVILVLAIGSLIILMALVALPSLQASQRDTQRKNDYATLESAITSYTSNNRGKLPGACTDGTTTPHKCTFIDTYIKDTWEDPSKGFYQVEVVAGSNTTYAKPTAGQVFVYTSSKCEGETAKYDSTLGSRRYAIYAYLESGTYCQAD